MAEQRNVLRVALDFWNRRNRWSKAGLMVLVLFVLPVTIAGIVSPAEDEPNQRAATQTAETSTEEEQAEEEEEPPPPPPPDEAGDADTGRMSQGEYDGWSSAVEDLNRESLEWSEGAQTCLVIGQSGDLAGFRDCVKESYRGFEDSVYFARDTTDGLMEDTGRQCLSTLKSYRTVLVTFAATNAAVYTFAESLRFSEMGEVAQRLPRAGRRYVRFATNAKSACEPR